MLQRLNLTDSQKNLKSELEFLHNQIWQYIESNPKSLSENDANNLYEEMAKKAHELHMSLKDSGHEPKHHKYMIENRGCKPDDERFYEHVHPVQDLLAFIENVDANNDPEDITIGKTFTMKVFTKRWGHYDQYEITRTDKGWDIKGLVASSYSCNKMMKPGLNELLKHDSVCYPKQINIFFEWLWDKAAEEGLSEADVQKEISQLGDWISKCEKNAPRTGVFEGLI